jgi:hypothetical protein
MAARLIFHPVLENKRSRLIFSVYLLIAAAIEVGFLYQLNYTLGLAGLARDSDMLLSISSIKFTLSLSFQIGLTVAVALFASALTARFVIGPIKRIEQWLKDWDDNLNPFPLLVRKNDKFVYFVSLLNALYQKLNRPRQQQ